MTAARIIEQMMKMRLRAAALRWGKVPAGVICPSDALTTEGRRLTWRDSRSRCNGSSFKGLPQMPQKSLLASTALPHLPQKWPELGFVAAGSVRDAGTLNRRAGVCSGGGVGSGASKMGTAAEEVAATSAPGVVSFDGWSDAPQFRQMPCSSNSVPPHAVQVM